MTSRVSVTRVVDWCDTDAAGHYHHSSVIRWVEAAENELHVQRGLLELFGVVPRVRYEVDYLDRLWFREEVVTELWVESLGRTSLVYGFEVTGPRGPAARGRMVCVNIGDRSGEVPAGADSPAVAWSDAERAALQGAAG
ncbi:acyl-CoA thioesterase [Ornithinimicrobium faecis]|uniref:acyl-CoA thioesterase n=1 Tax=Ornithinimicrobium faecis TaxID=2934158 RepID=UPI00211960E8|nr:thioesterase family protein [Ornithinimicrobium sp. HY1745]